MLGNEVIYIYYGYMTVVQTDYNIPWPKGAEGEAGSYNHSNNIPYQTL